ncbi:hypothetical protein WL11_26960 [Burkholderia ubonensis]|nr:hypothetical protein WL11_26960 [Burkholderia ubonensis]
MSGFTVRLAAVDGGQNPRFSGGDYAGTLMTDGWPAWRTVKTATHLGCLAQARRLFTDALKGQKNKPSPRVTKALEFFQALYQVEALAKQTLPEGETLTDYRYRLRQQHSVPLLTAFKAWLDELASKVLPQSLLGEAIGYCRRQWQYLIRYVMMAVCRLTITSSSGTSGRLPLPANRGCSAARSPARRRARYDHRVGARYRDPDADIAGRSRPSRCGNAHPSVANGSPFGVLSLPLTGQVQCSA